MKKLLLLTSLVSSFLAFSQVGIHTSEPAASFDIAAKNPTGITRNVDGLLIPRVDRERAQSMVGVPASTLIYVNSVLTGAQVGIAADIDLIGYYYFDGVLSKWVKLNPQSPTGAPNINIYNADGTIVTNRIVTQNDKTLAFTGTAVNAFSVDGTTLSVDATNHRVGVGTSAPGYKLDLGNSAGGTTSDVNGKLLAVYNGGGVFYGFGISPYTLQFHAGSSPTGEPPMVLTGNRLGIGTTTPQSSSILDVSSTTEGVLVPRMSTVQRDAIANKAEGLIIYNLDVHCLQIWNATTWISTCAGGTTPTNPGISTITDCTSGALNGTYQQGTAMTSSNTVTITVNVTQVGAWSITSAASNGVTFSGSGTFTALGSQTVTLTANGTPTASGSFNHTFTLGSSTCTRPITYTAGSTVPSTITDCTSGALNGTYQQGTAMTSSNTVTITVNATQVGAWSITSTASNGVTFSGSGTFVNTGSQTVTLTASGTPTASGSFNHTFALGSSTCTRPITYTAGVPSTITDCTSGALNGTYRQGTAMNSSNTVTITVNATQLGAWSITSAASNGVTFSGSGTFAALGSQTVTLTASGTPTSSGTFNHTFALGSSTCTRPITYTAGTGTATITDCNSGTLNGNYTQGVAMNSGNSLAITVNVTQVGPWVASTNTVNGVAFNGSGTFTSLGSQSITLTASGTPTNGGNATYTFTLGSSTCNRTIVFGSASGACTIPPVLGRSHFPGTYPIGNNLVGVTVTTSAGAGAVGTSCGGTTDANSWRLNSNSVTLTFSRPVKDVTFIVSGVTPGDQSTIVVSAKNGNTPVATTLSSTQACFQQPTVSNNKVNAVGHVDVGGNYYTSITISHTGTTSGGASSLNFQLCGATSL